MSDTHDFGYGDLEDDNFMVGDLHLRGIYIHQIMYTNKSNCAESLSWALCWVLRTVAIMRTCFIAYTGLIQAVYQRW